MNIVILNGNPDPQNSAFDRYLADLSTLLTQNGHAVNILLLRELKISYCTGCFGCWVKTPGECSTPDASHEMDRAIIHSDFTLWAAPLRLGFPSALLKKALDKHIPLLHPYFEVDHGEAHHRRRYPHYPLVGLLVQKETGTDESDLRLLKELFTRTALNFKSRLHFLHTTATPAEEVAAAIQTPVQGARRLPAYPLPPVGVQINPPMRLTVFNGSPRGKASNTHVMLEQFMNGFTSVPGRSAEWLQVNHLNELEQIRQAFAGAECAWLGFPLYTDGMPGMDKAFIEALEPLCGQPGSPPLGFLVQSGFPESAHSRYVEQYLHKLAARLGSPYLGTIVKGGCEGVRMMPENMNRKLFDGLFNLGKGLAENGRLDPAALRRLAQPERYPAYLAPVFKLLSHTSLLSFYWDGQLKRNGAFEKRFDMPYRS